MVKVDCKSILWRVKKCYQIMFNFGKLSPNIQKYILLYLTALVRPFPPKLIQASNFWSLYIKSWVDGTKARGVKKKDAFKGPNIPKRKENFLPHFFFNRKLLFQEHQVWIFGRILFGLASLGQSPGGGDLLSRCDVSQSCQRQSFAK